MRAYKANMIPGGVTPTINVSQYDNDYAVTVTLIEGAEIYTPPAGATIRVEGTKPDGHGFEYPCTYQGNVVTMPIYTQMTVVSGRFPIELVVYQSGLRVGSCNIIFAVEKAPLGEDTDISETVIPDIIAGVQAQADAAAASATAAAASATTASSAATNAVSARNAAIEAARAAAQSAASLTVDTELSSTSTNPVQNKVIDATVTELKNDLNTFSETGYIPYYSADSISGTGYINTDVLLPEGKYKLTISNIVSSDTDKTMSAIAFIQPNSGNVVYNLERGVAINLDFELTETCTRFICYASVSAGTSAGDSFTFSDVVIARAVLNDVYTAIDNKTTIISNLDSNFVLNSSGLRLDWFMGKLEGETVIFDSIPQGYKASLSGYTSSSYAANSKEFDSGWNSTAPVSFNINSALYYAIFITKTGGGDTPIVVASDFSGRILKSSNDSIKTNSSLFENYELIASQTVKTIGHRGSDILAPEDTAPSYIVAAKRGVKIVENDVFAKVDGNYVMWHDPTFVKLGNMVDITGKAIYTDGTGFYFYDIVNNLLYTYDFTNDEYVSSGESISNLSRCAGSSYTPTSFDFKMLRRIDVGVWKGSKYKGTTILTFNEFVLLCKQLGLEMYIDHKMDYTETAINELGAIVKNLGMLEHTTWVQIPLELIPVLRTIDNDARIAQLYVPTQELINVYSQYNTGRGIVFHGNASNYTAEKVQLGLDNGFEVEAYYVDFGKGLTDEQNFTVLRNLVAYGVTGISTDHYRVEDAYRYLLNQY